MSYDIVRKSLSLFNEDGSGLSQSDSASSVKKKKTKDAMKLISTNRKGVWKELRSLQSQIKHKNKPKKNDFKSAIEKYKQNAEHDKMEDNIQYFNKLSQSRKLKQDVTEKVLKHHKGKLSKNNPPKVEELEQQTAFTDRDFDELDKELDNFFS